MPGYCIADKRLRLKQADVLENITVDGQAYQILRGNVIFTKDNMTLKCQLARYFQKSGEGSLVDQVIVTKEDMTLVCDSLYYESSKEILKGYWNTHIWDDDYDLVADSLFYFSELDSGKAMGNVELFQKEQQVNADQIIYVKKQNSDAVSYQAIGNVTIQEEERLATCGAADYKRDEEITILRINPEVQEEDRVLAGSEIELRYKDDQLQQILIPADANARSIISGWQELTKSNPDSLVKKRWINQQDEMSGKVLKGFFKEGKLDSMRLEGMATTLYHIFEDSIYQGKNLSSGDTVVMQFADSTLDRITVSGGARGTYTPDSVSSSVEAPIIYKSKIIDYRIPEKTTDLHSDASIKYTDVDLSAGFVNVNWKSNILTAEPSSPLDTTGQEKRPTIIEKGREPMVGNSMQYNLQTKKGIVTKGRTKAEDGYYAGSQIRNEQEDVFYVQQSSYTTCDLEDPHFHFESRRMKMIQNDKVFARPLILHISHIPIIGLPFAIFPHQSGGRRSGWIMPSYGESRNRGQFIDGLGYYWAVSDYWDSKLLMSFADRQGFTLRLNNIYKKRYKYRGSLSLETRQRLGSGEKDITNILRNRKMDYVIKWSHNQTLRHNQSFSVSASYYSNGEYNRETGLDPVQRLKQQAISNATYSKRWPKSGNSLSLNLSSRRDLMAEKKIDPDDDNPFYQKPKKAGERLNITTNTLPNLNFRHGQSPLIKTKSSNKRWYHNVNWNYSTNFNNKLQTYYQAEEIQPSDSTSQIQWETNNDGIGKINSFSDNVAKHSLSINAPQKLFKYISVTPGMRFQSNWVNKTYKMKVDTNGTVKKEEVEAFATRTTGSFSIGTSTKIYGLFPLSVGSLRSIRHTITPNIGYSYTPDFSKPVLGQDLGYFSTYQDTSGKIVAYDRFAGTLAGSTPSSESQAMTLSLNNVFQAKLMDGEKEKKINLFRWNMSTSYNFVAEEFQLAKLNSSLRSDLMNKLKMDFSMTHDFYKYDYTLGKRVNTIIRNELGIPVPRLINARLTAGFTFSGKRLTQTFEADTTMLDTSDQTQLSKTSVENQLQSSSVSKKGASFWSTRVNFNYTYNNANPENPTKTFWMNTNSTLHATKNWRINYNVRFDLMRTELVSHSFSIYRDLHCWELSLSWTPSGFGQGFYLRINVKSPTLRDLKLEQKGGRYNRVPNW